MGKNKGGSASAPTLDLHGKTTDEVPDLVDRFLVRHQSSGHAHIRIMTGKGKGLVQKVVMDYLRLGGYHFSFERDASGKPNHGVLLIHLE